MRLYITLFVTVLTAMAVIPGTAIAGHHYHGYGMKMSQLTDADTNQDGLISFDEFSAMHTDKMKRTFDMLDADNDELISQQEWDEFLNAHGKYKKCYEKEDE